MLKTVERDPSMGHCNGCGWEGHLSRGLIDPTLPKPTPRMPYLSIDIETTGLNPDTCQILEIGVVWDDWIRPIAELPTYRRLVIHDEYRGNPYALALNAALLKQLAGPRQPWFLKEEEVGEDMAAWLKSCGWDGKNMTPAGKNFASFDRQFLKRLPGFEKSVGLHHRTLDPAILYWQPDDEKLPDSKTCYQRAGMDEEVAHTAVEDALGVVRLTRRGIERLWCAARAS